MNNKEIQYITLIKMDKNIKLDYQIFANNTIKSAEQFIFSLDNGNISAETISKIKVLESDTKNTIITAICEDPNQMILNKRINKNRNNSSITFNETHNIILGKENIKREKLFYNNSHIDYLISPFTILNEELIQNPIQNSLNIFIFNNILYSIFLDENKKLTFSAIKNLTPYDIIQKSNFYKDEISEQILYDEIYLLELENNISSLLSEYAEISGKQNSCKTINIFYSIKYLEAKQIETLKDNILININYIPIIIDDAVDAIVKKENIKQYSFIKKRSNKRIYIKIFISILVLITLAGTAYLSYRTGFINKNENILNSNKEIAKIEYPNLPNHIAENHNIVVLITNIFESIDDTSILKEIQISENESTIIYSFTDLNNYEKNLKPKFLKLYEQSENILTSTKQGISTSIISNTHLIAKNELAYKKYIPSKNTRFLSSSEAKKGIEELFNSTTIVKLINETRDKYTKYKYSVYTIIKSPKEFFDVIALLEKQDYSIVLDYPIGFAKTDKGLELNFRLVINQNNR